MAANTDLNTLTGKTIGILVADGSEQVEVTAPRDALAGAGAQVKVLTPDGSGARGYHYLQPQDEIPAQAAIDEVDPAGLDVLLLPGGLGGPDTLRTNPDAVGLVKACVEAGKPVGVICHGPWLLMEAGALAGRSLTCVPALRTDVTNAGASYVDAEVHVDRDESPMIVSGRNFEAADRFASALVHELAA